MYYRCSVPACLYPREDFVADDKRLKNWLDSLESDSLRSKSLSELLKLQLCQKHFEARIANLSSTSPLNKANPGDVIPEESTKSVQDGSVQHRNENLPVQVNEDEMCRICLRSEIAMVEEVDPALIDFLDELLYYDSTEDNGMCKVCEHQLRRFYNFRQRCRRAHILLKTTDKESLKLEKLQLPQLSLGICNSKSKQVVIGIAAAEPGKENSFENNTSDDKKELWFMLKPINQPMFIKMNENQKENLNLNADETYWDNGSISEVEVSDFDNSNRPVQIRSNDTLCHQIVGKDTKVLQIVGKDAKNLNILGKDAKNLQIVDAKNQKIVKDAKTLRIVGKDAKNLNILGKDAKNLQIVDAKNQKIVKDAKTLRIVGKDAKNLNILGKDAKNLQIVGKDAKKVGKGITKFSLKYWHGRALKKLTKFKVRVTYLIDNGEFSHIEDLGTKMSKEVFLNIIEKCPRAVLEHYGVLNTRAAVRQIGKCLERILRTHNPIYDELFDIKHLLTRDEQVAEFISRQYSKEYIEAQNRCEFCFRIFDSQGALTFHQKWHDTNLRYGCDICPMRFMRPGNKSRHHRNNHMMVYQCKLCVYLTYNEVCMREHYMIHKGITFDCDKCGRKFQNSQPLNKHIKNKHSSQRNCVHCGEYFATSEKYNTHFSSKHADVDETTLPPQQFKCEKCCLFFYNYEALLKHEEKHRELMASADVYMCFVCKERFDNPGELRTHKMTAQHTQMKKPRLETRTCTLCYEEIDSSHPRAMYQHFKMAHPAAPFIAGRSLLCEQCGQAFAHMSEYNAHMRAHNGDLPYECSECGKRFSFRSVAATHLRTHAKEIKEKPIKVEGGWQCPRCNKVLSQYANLKRHMLVHTGEKPYECSICLKRFSQSNSMKLHKLTVHEGQKSPYMDRRGMRGNVPKGGKVGQDNSDWTEMNNDEENANSMEEKPELGEYTPDCAEPDLNDEYLKEEIVYYSDSFQ